MDSSCCFLGLLCTFEVDHTVVRIGEDAYWLAFLEILKGKCISILLVSS